MVDPDASKAQLQCVLLQNQEENKLNPVGYWLRSLSSAERKYDTTHKECLAFVWSVLMFRTYLEGTNFVLLTNYQPLQWILNLEECTR